MTPSAHELLKYEIAETIQEAVTALVAANTMADPDYFEYSIQAIASDIHALYLRNNFKVLSMPITAVEPPIEYPALTTVGSQTTS